MGAKNCGTQLECSVEAALELFGGVWKRQIDVEEPE